MIVWLDILLLVVFVVAVYLGSQQRITRQAGYSLGVLLGIFLVAIVYERLGFLADGSVVRSILLMVLLVAVLVLCCNAGAALASRVVKQRATSRVTPWKQPGRYGSAVLAVATCLVVSWAIDILFQKVEPQLIREQTAGSAILGWARRTVLPPTVLTDVASILNPFSPPQAFVEDEPMYPGRNVLSRQYEGLDTAIARTEAAVVQVMALGCGTATTGSGFLVQRNLIVTNAHVVAGINRVAIRSASGAQQAEVVWFDPRQDIALLRTEYAVGNTVLAIRTDRLPIGSVAAVLGYAGDDKLLSSDAIILNRLEAVGYDIYGKDPVNRLIYTIRGAVVSGNSGGPLIAADGQLAGVLFGHSATQSRVGYAIDAQQVQAAMQSVGKKSAPVSTGACPGQAG